MNTEQNTYGIGIVGCGNISETHAEAIIRTGRGQLIAAHSRTEQTVEAFSSKYDISGYTSFHEFLKAPDLDVVVICTPTGTHLDYGQAAAEAGKHVIVEKPIEITVARGQSLIDSCKDNEVKLAVIYQSRFIDDVKKMKELVDNKTVGDVVMASASVKWFRDQEYYSGSSWRGTFELDGGGAVINQSIHTIDLLQWFVGGVKSIAAFKGTFTHEGIEAEDNAVACLEFNNGAIGVFEASTSITPPQDRTVEINGTKGTLLLEGDRLQKTLQDQSGEPKQDSPGDAAGAASPLAGMTFKNHKNQYDAILDAFHSDTAPVVSGEDSLQSLAIVEALYTSADKQEVIYIDDILDTGDVD
ncbi:Gfo/Idh/MocA family protein [Fodinibius sediminis]|uniref:Predicted dehydrogenase n=1 Tax=Fodinibius sediminis TaxID=1214077 RepID=A0A521CTB6_9BACT|nr:Gfo/Idh/MocA family oxidoreductase [Fodinibius sediminis]SMO62719.1 Predicted dehydrogenase [Fodinibius sediminis]